MTVETAVTVEKVETAVTVEMAVTVETAVIVETAVTIETDETVETAVTCETDETVETGVTVKKTKVTWRFTNSVLLLIVLSLTCLKCWLSGLNWATLWWPLGQLGLIQNWVSPG